MTQLRPDSRTAQVSRILRQRIRSGEYAPGGRLPPESALSRHFAVSRASVRTALARLSAEGLIVRRQGDGTFVNEHLGRANTAAVGMLHFRELIEAAGHTAAIHALSVARRGATLKEAIGLDIEVDDPVIAFVRLFTADETPCILARNVIDATLFDDDIDIFDGRLPIQSFLKRYCGRQLSYALYEIGSTLANGVSAEFLQCPPRSALLKLSAIFYDKKNLPIVFGTSYFNDRVISLRSIQSWL